MDAIDSKDLDTARKAEEKQLKDVVAWYAQASNKEWLMNILRDCCFPEYIRQIHKHLSFEALLVRFRSTLIKMDRQGCKAVPTEFIAYIKSARKTNDLEQQMSKRQQCNTLHQLLKKHHDLQEQVRARDIQYKQQFVSLEKQIKCLHMQLEGLKRQNAQSAATAAARNMLMNRKIMMQQQHVASFLLRQRMQQQQREQQQQKQ